MSREARVGVGVAVLLGVVLAAYQAPVAVGALLLLFAILVFVFGVVGLVRPTVMNLPSRLAAVWVMATAFGLFLGGGMLISPAERPGSADPAPIVRREPVQVTQQSQPGQRVRPVTDPCNVTTEQAAQMTPQQVDLNWEACLRVRDELEAPEVEAARHLREAADCLDLTRGQVVSAADRAPALAQRQVELVLVSCGLAAILDHPDLSGLAKVEVLVAVNRLDLTVIELATDRAGLGRAVDALSAGLRQQADRIEP